MKQILPNVYEYQGIKAEAVVRQSGRPCNGCPFDINGRPCPLPGKTCTPIIGADKVFRKYKEPETVKKTELNELKFSVIVLDSKRSRTLQEAIIAAGGSWCGGSKEVRLTEKMVLTFAFCEITANNCISENPTEVTLQQALDLLATVEKPEPVFDVKPFDKVLARMNKQSLWNCDLYNVIDIDGFWVIGGFGDTSAAMLVKYEGNEALLGTTDTPSGRWEARNSKPVWVTK